MINNLNNIRKRYNEYLKLYLKSKKNQKFENYYIQYFNFINLLAFNINKPNYIFMKLILIICTKFFKLDKH